MVNALLNWLFLSDASYLLWDSSRSDTELVALVRPGGQRRTLRRRFHNLYSVSIHFNDSSDSSYYHNEYEASEVLARLINLIDMFDSILII